MGGRTTAARYEWTSPCCPAGLVDASDEAVAAIPKDTLAGEQIRQSFRPGRLSALLLTVSHSQGLRCWTPRREATPDEV